MLSEGNDWLSRSRSRCRWALRQRSSPADRLALVQTLARLSGGRLDLAEECLSLSSEEYSLLPRFGLRSTKDGDAVRLEDDGLDDLAPGLSKALALDPNPRTVFTPCAADAALLRF